MNDLVSFLRQLDSQKIAYHLDRVRDATMVVVAIPGERWEVEFMDDGDVEVEKFRSDGSIQDAASLDDLFGTDAPG